MRIKVLLIILVFLSLVGCSANSQPGVALTINLSEFAYTPSVITVSTGQEVTLTIYNEGAIEHDFVIGKIPASNIQGNMESHDGHMANDMGEMNYDLHVSIPAGESAILKFTPTEAGTYEFLCTVAGHKEAGMTGVLIVENLQQ